MRNFSKDCLRYVESQLFKYKEVPFFGNFSSIRIGKGTPENEERTSKLK